MLGRWVKRYLARVRPDEVRRAYAAASTNLSTGAWTVADRHIRDLVSADAATIRARVRQLVRDTPYVARAVDVLVGYTAGTGLEPRPRVIGPDGTPDRDANARILDAWQRWTEEADVADRLHFGDIQALAKRCEVEAGEFVVLEGHDPDPKRFLPYCLQVLEPDQLSGFARVRGGAEVLDGVEYDPRTGKALAYHFDLDDTAGPRTVRSVRMPAHRVIHGFHTLRPGQLRGVSVLAPAVLLAHALRDYSEHELDAARLAARYVAFITTPDPGDTMAALGAADSVDFPSPTDGQARKVEEIGGAIKEYLLPGESVEFTTNNRPGGSFGPFTTYALQLLAALTGTSYELLSGNYGGLNYTTIRGSRNDLAKGLEVHHARLIRQLCQPVYRTVLRRAVVAGRLDLPNFFTEEARYTRATWLSPGLPQVDPQREGRADAEAVRARLKSPIEIMRRRGRHPEDVLDEIAEFADLCEARGLDPDQAAQTATQPAPARTPEDPWPVRRVK